MKGTWQTVNQLVNKRSKSTNISCLDIGRNQISDRSKVENCVNDYFCSLSNAFANEIPDKLNPSPNGDYSVNMSCATFRFTEINPQDVSRAIGKFKSSKSFGVYMISIKFLKIILLYISLPLAFIFTAFLRACKFPDAWKIARAISIYKEGEKNQRSNYRPISILPVISR